MLNEAGCSALPSDLLALAERLESLGGGGGGDIGLVDVRDGVPSSSRLVGRTRVAEVEVVARIKASQEQGGVGQDVWVDQGRRVSLRRRLGHEHARQGSRGSALHFLCSSAFAHTASSGDVCGRLGQRLVDEWLLQGFNVSVVGMGGSGCGKTYSLQGCSCLDPKTASVTVGRDEDGPGASLVWQVLERLFHQQEKKQKQESTYAETIVVGLSCWEVGSDDSVNDLLKQNGSITRRQQGFVSIACSSLAQTAAVINRSRRQSANWAPFDRSVLGDSGLGAKGGKTHSFIRVSVCMMGANGVSRSATMHIVDLVGSLAPIDSLGRKAGSARSNNNSGGLARRERHAVNLQLLGVERLIGEISDLQVTRDARAVATLACARESRLTMMLAPLLGSNCKAVIFAALSGHASRFKENLAVLRLASRAKLINTACLRSQCGAAIKDHVVPFHEAFIELSTRETGAVAATCVPAPCSTIGPDLIAADALPPATGTVEKEIPTLNQDQGKKADSSKAASASTVLRKVQCGDQEELGRDPLLASLLSKVRAAKTELEQIERDFQQERAVLERNNQATRDVIQDKSLGKMGAAQKLHADDREEAKSRQQESDVSVAKMERRVCAVGVGLDIIELCRSEIAVLDANSRQVQAEIEPLLNQRRLGFVRQRFLHNLEKTSRHKTKLQRQTRGALAQAQSGLAERQRSVKELELQQHRLEQDKDRLQRDRQATSREVLEMRKFLSEFASDAERETVLRSLRNAAGDESFQHLENAQRAANEALGEPGVPKHLGAMIDSLESSVGRDAPFLTANVARLRDAVDILGLQFCASKGRQKQLLLGMRELLV